MDGGIRLTPDSRPRENSDLAHIVKRIPPPLLFDLNFAVLPFFSSPKSSKRPKPYQNTNGLTDVFHLPNLFRFPTMTEMTDPPLKHLPKLRSSQIVFSPNSRTAPTPVPSANPLPSMSSHGRSQLLAPLPADTVVR